MNITKQEAIDELVRADRKIKKRTRYECGLVSEEVRKEIGCGDFFFESPDNQNGELRSELIKLGWNGGEYSAPYHWKVYKGGFQIWYVEGDIYLKQVNIK